MQYKENQSKLTFTLFLDEISWKQCICKRNFKIDRWFDEIFRQWEYNNELSFHFCFLITCGVCKNFVKVTSLLIMSLLNSWFDEFFDESMYVNLSFFHNHNYLKIFRENICNTAVLVHISKPVNEIFQEHKLLKRCFNGK